MKVLIAVDGSQPSDEAVRAISRRALEPGSIIRLVYVCRHEPQPRELDHIALTFERCTSILTASADQQYSIQTETVEGPIRERILEEAERLGADLIAVGSRGHSMLENVLLGSISQAVLDHAKCPVVVAREVQPAAIGKIIVAVDDSEFSAAAVEWVARQPWAHKKEIALVSVVEHSHHVSVGMHVTEASQAILEWQTERGLLQLALDYWTKWLRGQLPTSDIRAGVIDGDTRHVLVEAANNWPAEIVVLGSHGRRGFKKLLMGSVSQNVAANADCSVEIVRGVPSQHYLTVHAMIEQQRQNSPLNNEPTKRDLGYAEDNQQPKFFFR
jgi:nucleotide-binding universal stress UspA family protein